MPGTENGGVVFRSELDDLFFRRTVLVFWSGIVSFLLFSLLDFLIHRQLFPLFFTYRLAFVCFLLVCLDVLQFRRIHPYSRQVLALALAFASFTISLMILELGGFRSEYYIGIVLVAAFVLSVLPLNVLLASGLGLGMYLVYFLTVKTGGASFENDNVYAVNNTFFYMSIFFAIVVKCYDDTKRRKVIWNQRAKVKELQRDLSIYTGDLEEVVQQRLKQIKELNFRYSELYNNIQDMVVALNEQGDISLFNRRFGEVFAIQIDKQHHYNFFDFLVPEQRREVSAQFLMEFELHNPFLGFEVQMITSDQSVWTVEISGNWIRKDDGGALCQMVLRNITRRKRIEQQTLKSTRLVDRSRRSAIIGLAKLAEYRDADTGSHLEHIQVYTRLLTRKLSESRELEHILTPDFLEDITLSSVLHDIGKVGIPDSILLKPGKLSLEEFDEMKNHSVYGSNSLAAAEREVGDVSFMTMGQEIAHFHHEKWDGSGYPLGLRGLDIPLSARIVALADVYDALTSRRCYKASFNHEQARAIIVENRGTHFDPDVVDAFLAQEQEFKRIRMKMLLQK